MTVNLQKGQKISLAKPGGGTLTNVRMGLGWDAMSKGGLFSKRKEIDIDLDASCIMFGAAGDVIDKIYFGHLTSEDGAVRHTGDNLTGAGDGDDESIVVNLQALPASVTTLVFTVSSFQGQTFAQIENAFCRLVDESSNSELARYDLSGSGSHTAQIMAKVSRDGAAWSMTALGTTANGRTIQDLVPAAQAAL